VTAPADVANRSAGELPALRRALVALAGASVVAGVVAVAVVLSSDHLDDRGATAALGLIVGWSFAGTGLLAWWRRPANRTGALMVAAAFAWFAQSLSTANGDLPYTIGLACDALFPAFVGHLVVAFPDGRLHSRAERLVVAAGYVTTTLLQVPSLLFEEHTPGEPRNLLVVRPDQVLSDRLDLIQFLAAAVVIAVSLTLVARRWNAATALQRRALAPMVWTSGAAFLVLAVAAGLDAAGAGSDVLENVSLLMLAAVPFAFLAGLLRTRLAAGDRISALVERLGRTADAGTVRDALADALGDPSVALAYWLPAQSRFVDADGRPVTLRDGAWTEVELHGRRIAAIAHDPSLADQRQLVGAAGAAVALALENERLAAELRARIEELRASRARLVRAGDDERRRLERDLHDGAQSRMVALAVQLGVARRRADGDAELAALLDASRAELATSLDELRELARGIHPAVLTDRGLGAALGGLATRAPVAVEVAEPIPGDLPAPVATAVYFVVAEALTNVAKYAQAEHATVAVTRADDAVRAEVADDGVGGASAAGGSGLRGLADRVAALDGRLEIDSPAGGGTRVWVEIPLGTAG
jgi:signal transduction histidine kinase